MSEVLRVLVLSTIFMCCSNVFNSALISLGKNWQLFSARIARDVMLLGITYYLVLNLGRNTGAMDYAIATAITSALYFLFIGIYTFRSVKAK